MLPKRETYSFLYRKPEATPDSNLQNGSVEFDDSEIHGDENIVNRVYAAANLKYGELEIVGGITGEDGIDIFPRFDSD